MTPERFLEVAELFADPALLLARDGTVLAANRAVDALGWSAPALTGRRLAEVTATAPEQVDDYLRLSVRSHDGVPGSLELLAAGGVPTRCRCRAARIGGADEEPRIVLRCTPSAAAPSRFAVLNQKIARLTEEIHRRKAAEERLHQQTRALEKSEDASRFLADASAALAAVDDAEGTLQKVAWLAVPRFGDWSTIHRVEPDGVLRRVAVAHVDPDKLERARRLQECLPPNPKAPLGPLRVAHSGEPELAEEVPDDLLLAAAGSDEHLAALRELGLTSYISVPMKAGGRILGVITFVTGGSPRRYRTADLALAQGLADRAAVALENARLYAELVEADRRKDEFLATLAHELRNPLAPIRNALEILGAASADSEVAERMREMMERQVQHLVRLVDDLLDVSRVMRGKVELKRRRIDLAEVIAHAVETVRPEIDAQRQELTLDLPERPVEIEGDPVRLTQVVANLLANSAKYTPAGGSIRLTLAADDEAGAAVIRVRDDGVGIAPELLAKVFDLFVQADGSGARSGGGLGIGLTLVRSLVTLHGGTVEAHSEGSGTGSEFTVRLPLAGAPPTADLEAVPRAEPPGHIRARRRVLVVDDNVDAAESLATLLRLSGSAVAVAHDGPTALELARDHEPEIVLLDLGMPLMDGYEVARRLRSEWTADVLLVALTGWGQEEDRRRTAEAGFDLHLVKPVEPGTLEGVLVHPKLRRVGLRRRSP